MVAGLCSGLAIFSVNKLLRNQVEFDFAVLLRNQVGFYTLNLIGKNFCE